MAYKFSANSKRRKYHYPEVDRARDTRNVKRAHKLVKKLLGKNCIKCGKKGTKASLIPGHTSKYDTLSSTYKSSEALVRAAAGDFQMLCETCWRKKMSSRFPPRKHGTYQKYATDHCRCRRCKTAWAAYALGTLHARKERRRTALVDLKEGRLNFLKPNL